MESDMIIIMSWKSFEWQEVSSACACAWSGAGVSPERTTRPLIKACKEDRCESW